MSRKTFREQIAEQLSGLAHEDVCFFAWLCAVRALPLLGAKGNLDYWNNASDGDMRQKHLSSILKALDVAAADAASWTMTANNDNYSFASSYIAATYVAAAANAAAAASFSEATAYVYSACDAAYYAATAARSVVDLNPVLLQDLADIRAGNNVFQNSIPKYNDIWDSFQSALCDIGCKYWADWYAALYAKGFSLSADDKTEMELRLNVPEEFTEQGAAVVARYVMDIKEKGAERLNEARILILGEKGSGKTSLALRLKEPTHPMPGDNNSTEGVNVIDWHIDAVNNQPDSEVNVHIWDFAGHVITHAAHRCFMSERCLYILLINGRTEGDNRTEYWLEQIRNYGGDSPVLILVNIKDKHPVELLEKTLKNTFSAIQGFYQVDIDKGGDDLENFRQVVMGYLRDHPLWKNQMISAPAYKVKEALKMRFVSGNDECIQRDEFNSIASNSGVAPEEYDQLLKDLHALGICLWYDDAEMREYGMMVLNPSWISHGIYRLINWGLGEKKHVLSTIDLPNVFIGSDAARYPDDKTDFLFRLMKTYQLAFFKDTKRIFVPLLLPADRPDEDSLLDFPFGERLRMEYRADQALPPYTVARLAVLHSDELDEERSWRFGALLRWNSTDAFVVEDEHARSVSVSVKGPERTEYISRLRSTLDRIFDDYKSSRPELNIELLIPEDLPSEIDVDNQALGLTDVKKFMQPEEQIIANARVGQMLFTGNSRLPWINLMETMRGYGLVVVMGDVVAGDKITDVVAGDKITYDYSQTFQNCSVGLQEELNSLARSLRRTKNPETIELADEFEEIALDLQEIEKEMPEDSQPDSSEMKETTESLRKKGLLKLLDRLGRDLSDKDSDLYKKMSKVRNGIKTVQELGKGYNSVAQWFGLPQIPKPFLGTTGD